MTTTTPAQQYLARTTARLATVRERVGELPTRGRCRFPEPLVCPSCWFTDARGPHDPCYEPIVCPRCGVVVESATALLEQAEAAVDVARRLVEREGA